MHFEYRPELLGKLIGRFEAFSRQADFTRHKNALKRAELLVSTHSSRFRFHSA
jgi:hypothetical protein